MTIRLKTTKKDSFVNLMSFLSEVTSEPGKFASDSLLVGALSRQSRLAKYGNAERSIYPTSRSTLERVADRELPRGKKQFDDLRRQALSAIQSAGSVAIQPSQRSKAGMASEIDLLLDERRRAHLDCYQLSAAFYEAIVAARSVISWSKNETLKAKWKKEEVVLLSMRRFARHSSATPEAPSSLES